MHRRTLLVLSLVTLLGALLVGGGTLAAQDTGSEYADHPAVGTWIVTADPENPQSQELAILTGDGTALDASEDGTVAVGVWEPTGDATATVTFIGLAGDEGRIIIRATIEIAPDGQSFTGTYTNEFLFDPASGESSGEIGPGTVTGTRMTPEAPGTPVGSFEDVFGTPGATPAATPGA